MREYFDYKKYKTAFLLTGILIIAFLLRVWGVNFGLPGLFYCDERFLPYNALFTITHHGKLMKGFFYGNLIPYMLGLFYGAYFIILKIIGLVKTPYDFLVLYMKDPSTLYLIGRMVFVTASTLSVWGVYLLGTKLYNKTVGLLSAFFLAFCFLPIHQAKFMKGDTLGTLFLLFSFYYIMKNINNVDEIKKYIISGIFIGLAISARFTLWLGLLYLMFICFIDNKAEINLKIRNVILLNMITIATFLITTPSLIFQFYEFINEIKTIILPNLNPQWGSSGSQPVWLFYLTEHLRKGIGFPLEIIAILGVIISLIRLVRSKFKYKKEELGIIVFLILFFGTVLNPSPNWERYIIPLIPFFTIFAANFLYLIVMKLKLPILKKQLLLGVLSVAIVFPNLPTILKYNYLVTQPDTRNVARNFIEKTIPAGTKIVTEGAELIEPTSVLGVPLRKNKEQLKDSLQSIKEQNMSAQLLYAMIDANMEPSYMLDNISFLDKPPYKNVNYDTTVKVYIDRGVEYLIASSWVRHPTNMMPVRFFNSLNQEYKLVKEFNPYPVFKWDYYCWRIDYDALSKVSIFDKNVIGGPVIKIYKRRV